MGYVSVCVFFSTCQQKILTLSIITDVQWALHKLFLIRKQVRVVFFDLEPEMARTVKHTSTTTLKF